MGELPIIFKTALVVKKLTLIDELNGLKKQISRRDWILDELSQFENKYGLSTQEFIKNWSCGAIPEPADHHILEDFLEWSGLAESLEKVENELKGLEEHIRKS